MLDTGGVVMFTRALRGLMTMGIRANVLCPEVLAMFLGLAIIGSNWMVIILHYGSFFWKLTFAFSP